MDQPAAPRIISIFSNSNQYLSLLAPGHTHRVPGGGFAGFNGTSMAAAHVAGAWAILKSASDGTVTEILNEFARQEPESSTRETA